MWLHITCTSDKTKGLQEMLKTKWGRPRVSLTIQAERRNQGVGGGSCSRLSYLVSWLWVGMLGILCTEQVREVRGFEQIHYFALLRFTAHFSILLCLVVKTENLLDLYFTGAFRAVTSNNLLKLVATASQFGAVTLIYNISVSRVTNSPVAPIDVKTSQFSPCKLCNSAIYPFGTSSKIVSQKMTAAGCPDRLRLRHLY